MDNQRIESITKHVLCLLVPGFPVEGLGLAYLEGSGFQGCRKRVYCRAIRSQIVRLFRALRFEV